MTLAVNALPTIRVTGVEVTSCDFELRSLKSQFATSNPELTHPGADSRHEDVAGESVDALDAYSVSCDA